MIRCDKFPNMYRREISNPRTVARVRTKHAKQLTVDRITICNMIGGRMISNDVTANYLPRSHSLSLFSLSRDPLRTTSPTAVKLGE